MLSCATLALRLDLNLCHCKHKFMGTWHFSCASSTTLVHSQHHFLNVYQIFPALAHVGASGPLLQPSRGEGKASPCFSLSCYSFMGSPSQEVSRHKGPGTLPSQIISCQEGGPSLLGPPTYSLAIRVEEGCPACPPICSSLGGCWTCCSGLESKGFLRTGPKMRQGRANNLSSFLQLGFFLAEGRVIFTDHLFSSLPVSSQSLEGNAGATSFCTCTTSLFPCI